MSVRLQALQQDFQAYLLDHEATMRERIVGSPKADPETRLNIYADAYVLRLLEVLEADYDGLHGLVGDEAFDEIGRAYIEAHPSRHRSVRWFGQHMESFLRGTEPYEDVPVLAEMAAFEWAKGLVFDATEADAVTVEDVAAIAPEDWGPMVPMLHPSVRRIDLQWNIPALWIALEQEQEPPEPAAEDYPKGWLLWRADYDVYWRSLEVDEACAIDACFQGRSFGDICELLCEWHSAEQAPAQAAGHLKRWIVDGLVATINFD